LPRSRTFQRHCTQWRNAAADNSFRAGGIFWERLVCCRAEAAAARFNHNFEIAREIRNDPTTPMFCSISVLWRNAMSKLGILGATALSLTLAIAAPANAAGRGGGGGAHFGGGGGAHFGGGGGMHVGGGAMHLGGGNVAAFRGAQASMGPARAATAPVNGGNFAGRAQFAQGGAYRGFHGRGGRGFGAGAGFVAGLAAGSALGYGYGYDPSYYGPDYAYDDYYDGGYPVDQGYVTTPGYVVSGGADPAYCAQRYRSYDPASGTYLGYDGLRHPCGE